MAKKPQNRPRRRVMTPREGSLGRKAIGDTETMAVVLSHAATFGVTAAAKEFGLNRRTIQRYQAEVRDGKHPELSRLIARESDRAKERNRSKLHRALDAFLDRSLELAPKASMKEILEGVTRIGDLVTKREVFLGEPDGRDSRDAPDEGSRPGDPEGESQEAVH